MRQHTIPALALGVTASAIATWAATPDKHSPTARGAVVAVVVGLAVFAAYEGVFLVRDRLRARRAKAMSAARPKIDLDTFHAMQDDAGRYRPRDGWIATCEPEAGVALEGVVRFGAGVRLRVKGPAGDPFSLFRCEVLGPQGDRLAEYEDTDSDDGEFLPSIHPRAEHSVRWPEQFAPSVPDPVPAGVYRVGWVGESGGRWLNLASSTFVVTPEGEYRC